MARTKSINDIRLQSQRISKMIADAYKRNDSEVNTAILSRRLERAMNSASKYTRNIENAPSYAQTVRLAKRQAANLGKVHINENAFEGTAKAIANGKQYSRSTYMGLAKG